VLPQRSIVRACTQTVGRCGLTDRCAARYYHYSTGDPSVGANYEEVLPKVKAYHESIGVPFQHWQFDSWFYPKDGPVAHGGGGGAVTNWTSMPSVFPHGMQYIQELLKVKNNVCPTTMATCIPILAGSDGDAQPPVVKLLGLHQEPAAVQVVQADLCTRRRYL
jgi:hypothetical protein